MTAEPDLRALWSAGKKEELADIFLGYAQVEGLQRLGEFIADLILAEDASHLGIVEFLDLFDLDLRAAIAKRKAKNAAFAAQIDKLLDKKGGEAP